MQISIGRVEQNVFINYVISSGWRRGWDKKDVSINLGHALGSILEWFDVDDLKISSTSDLSRKSDFLGLFSCPVIKLDDANRGVKYLNTALIRLSYRVFMLLQRFKGLKINLKIKFDMESLK